MHIEHQTVALRFSFQLPRQNQLQCAWWNFHPDRFSKSWNIFGRQCSRAWLDHPKMENERILFLMPMLIIPACLNLKKVQRLTSATEIRCFSSFKNAMDKTGAVWPSRKNSISCPSGNREQRILWSRSAVNIKSPPTLLPLATIWISEKWDKQFEKHVARKYRNHSSRCLISIHNVLISAWT